MSTLHAYLTLALAPGVGPVRVRRLLEHLGSVEAILAAPESALQAVEGIGPDLAHSIYQSARQSAAVAEMERAAQRGLTLLHQEDPRYPGALREIYDPPLVLYVQGTIPERWPRGVGMVGSRVCSRYGEDMAKKIGYQLAYAGVPVVSGLARGIDTAAHMGALAAKGPTWAVLGFGLDLMYPEENATLADRIVTSGGCLLSEFPLGTKPDRQTFPMRNRIISGLSFGVLVVEAPERSGALITARMALEQNRTVYAIPGRIDQPYSKGCHQLIKDGAKLVEGVDDILNETQYLFRLPEQSTAPRPVPDNLSANEKTLFDLLGADELHIDSLITQSGLSAASVSSTLLTLEMKKLVRQLPGKVFVRTA